MPVPYSHIAGKAVKYIAKLRGGGSALPGLFVETIDKDFIPRTLAKLPEGVVVVSGTNGKTTTTKMIVELLESQGKKVFTNRTGSNFTRGVAAALLGDIDIRGNLDADIAVLELDEAHAVHFVRAVKPRYTLLLNVMRDQLDRFGEIDATADLLKKVAIESSEAVIVNREDPRLRRVAGELPQKKAYFGLSGDARDDFPSDDDMRSKNSAAATDLPNALTTLDSLSGKIAKFTIDDAHYETELKLDGIYNIYNAAAALAVIKTILPEADNELLFASLSQIKPAFGRGEVLMVNGQPLELVLVKNPGGFRLGLKSFDPAGYATMIAINDNFADGRDMSWLWDVDFDSLRNGGVSMISGIRAYDMALRLQYDEVEFNQVETDLEKALKQFIHSQKSSPKRIYCSYTAMIELRKALSKYTNVEDIS